MTFHTMIKSFIIHFPSRLSREILILTFNIVSYRVTEEYNLVANPIYNIFMQRTPEQRKITTSTSTTAVTTTRGDAESDVNYEEVTNLHGNKPSTSIVDTPAAVSQLGTYV